MPARPYYIMSMERGTTLFPSLVEAKEYLLTKTLANDVYLKEIDRIAGESPTRPGGYRWIPVYEYTASGEVFWLTASLEWMVANGTDPDVIKALTEWKEAR